MAIIKKGNIKIHKYGTTHYAPYIINKGKSKRSLAVGLFNKNKIRQWLQVIRAFDRDFPEVNLR